MIASISLSSHLTSPVTLLRLDFQRQYDAEAARQLRSDGQLWVASRHRPRHGRVINKSSNLSKAGEGFPFQARCVRLTRIGSGVRAVSPRGWKQGRHDGAAGVGCHTGDDGGIAQVSQAGLHRLEGLDDLTVCDS